MAQVASDPRDELMASVMGLRVQGVGRLVKPPGHLSNVKRRTLKAFALVYLDGGGGIFESAATGESEIRAGTLFVLFPGVWHRYGPREADQWREYWTIFDGFIPERYRQAGLLDPARPFFDMGTDSELLRRWKECLYLAESAEERRAQTLSGRMYALLGHVFAVARPESREPGPRQRLVESVIAVMNGGLADPGFRLEDHAGKFALSYSALRQAFSEATGVPPAQYLARMRVQRAQARLLSGGEPVKAIAAALGFPDPYHFSRRFRQIVGLSPEAFRRAFRPPAT